MELIEYVFLSINNDHLNLFSKIFKQSGARSHTSVHPIVSVTTHKINSNESSINQSFLLLLPESTERKKKRIITSDQISSTCTLIVLFRFRLMWNQLRSFVHWLHEPDHVARFQRYFGVLPLTNRQPDVIPKTNILNQNNNNNSNKTPTDLYQRHHERKVTYDANVLDECLEEIKHSTNESKKSPEEIDYKITIWFWYYFFQFGAALGNEIFYIVFFPTW